MTPATPEAYQLLHMGSIALAQVEANGIRIDTGYLAQSLEDITKRILDLSTELRADPIFKTWRKAYGEKASLTSSEQFGHVLFDLLKVPYPEERTEEQYGARWSTDKEILACVDLPFVKKHMELTRLRYLKNTTLEGIRSELVGDVLHPVFSLHSAVTFRGAASAPNSTNIPKRDEDSAAIVRRCFIPRPGNLLVEIDYSNLEVRIGCCYHRDPKLIKYINSPKADMHRDMSVACYLLTQDQVTDQVRDVVKAAFVFQQFYGGYYVQCASSMWNAIKVLGLKRKDGVSLSDHLAEHDITGLDHEHAGGFEEIIQKAEKLLWERFAVYAQWKRDWWNAYLRNGHFIMHTGFRCVYGKTGFMKRNDCTNYPIQGSAFHCLLWSLIRLQRQIERRGLNTMLIGQIHDSILADVPEEELQEVLTMASDIMTGKIMQAWDWITVPLLVKASAGHNWSEMERVKIAT